MTNNNFNFRKKIIVFTIFAFSFVLTFSFLSAAALAQSSDVCPKGWTIEKCLELGLNNVGGAAGYGPAGGIESTDLSQKIGNIISYVLGLVGVVFLVLIIMGGVQWMVGGEKGEKEKIGKAQSLIKNATIGLIIVLSAYVITFFVVRSIRTSINTPQASPEEPAG